jgi:hypothetical protein
MLTTALTGMNAHSKNHNREIYANENQVMHSTNIYRDSQTRKGMVCSIIHAQLPQEVM